MIARPVGVGDCGNKVLVAGEGVDHFDPRVAESKQLCSKHRDVGHVRLNLRPAPAPRGKHNNENRATTQAPQSGPVQRTSPASQDQNLLKRLTSLPVIRPCHTCSASITCTHEPWMLRKNRPASERYTCGTGIRDSLGRAGIRAGAGHTHRRRAQRSPQRGWRWPTCGSGPCTGRGGRAWWQPCVRGCARTRGHLDTPTPCAAPSSAREHLAPCSVGRATTAAVWGMFQHSVEVAGRFGDAVLERPGSRLRHLRSGR